MNGHINAFFIIKFKRSLFSYNLLKICFNLLNIRRKNLLLCSLWKNSKSVCNSLCHFRIRILERKNGQNFFISEDLEAAEVLYTPCSIIDRVSGFYSVLAACCANPWTTPAVGTPSNVSFITRFLFKNVGDIVCFLNAFYYL